jgi:hypothetical protein
MFRLALDKEAPEGKWQAAAINFFELARGAREAVLIEQGDKGKLAAMSSEVKIGEHAGKTVWWLVANKPEYVRWLLGGDCKHCLSEDLREEFEAELKRQGK